MAGKPAKALQNGRAVGRKNLVVSFLKGSRGLNPPHPFTVPTWDLPTLLRALKSPPFEPLQSVGLRSLMLKTFWILEHFMLPFADQLLKDADFIFQQDLAPAHTAKSTKSWLNDHGVGVLDWPANSPDLNPTENLWGIVKRKMRNKRSKNADELKATVKETWASIPPQPCHKLITSMPRQIEAVIKAKGAPTKYYTVHIQ